jgi:hypothetical protein
MKGKQMRNAKGFNVLEVLVIMVILAIIFIGGTVWLVVRVVKSAPVDALIHKNEYVLEAKSLADNLGDPERKGHGNKAWDPNDAEELMTAMGYPKNTRLEDVPSAKIREFVLKNRKK